MKTLTQYTQLLTNKFTKKNVIAPVESSSTASQAYTEGKKFFYNNILYEATADIAQGGLIVPNTNCTPSEDIISQIEGHTSGLLPHFIIVSDVGSIVTVTTPSGDIITPEAVSTDHWECDVPEYGVYTIDAVLAGDDAQVTVTVDDVKIYTIDDSHFHASITATFPNGASCRCYKNSVVYYATSTPYTFSVNSAGTWTVECTYNGITKSQTVTITTEGQSESTTIEYASIEVTYVDAIKGLTISCTDGTTTYTKTAPSSSNTVTFTIPTIGNWTVSTTDGTLVSSETVTVSSMTSYSVELTFGFDYKQWVTLGGLDPTDYTDLEDVFADKVAVRRLMTIHASADYLIEKVTDDVDTIDDFTANDTAMKWIGLRDYVCDGLTAITGVEAKFLASQYWERYLKDHVPTMTSNSAPYGTASMATAYSGSSAYHSFANSDSVDAALVTGTSGSIQYKFTNPINIKKVTMKENGNAQQIAIKAMAKDITFSVSNDGITWENVGTASNTDVTLGKEYVHDIDYDGYYLYFKITASNNNGQSSYTEFGKLQFYGRSLDVSVPVMTSDTTPYGTVYYDYPSPDSSEPLWRVFDNNDSTNGTLPLNTYTSDNVGYQFTSKVKIKKAYLVLSNSTYSRLKTVQVKYSNDGTTFYDATDEINVTSNKMTIPIEVDEEAQYWEMVFVRNETNKVGVYGLQFYGVDYSEKEFEAGTTKKWLYDHGVELETINTTGTVTKGDDYITLSAANAQASNTLDLTPYDLLRGKVGDHMSGTTALIVGTTATANMTAANAPNNESLDVSSVNASLATGAKMTSTGICDITELWLE